MLLYHIEFINDKEHFEKIGITKYDVFKRFGSKTTSMYKNYKVRILELLDIPDNIARIIEKEIHQEYKDYSYKPSSDNFSGKTECFEPNRIDISKYKKVYNRYKNIVIEDIKEDIIKYQYDNKLKRIKVKYIYNKIDLEYDEEEKFWDPRENKYHIALIKDKKLYAKSLENGYYYKVSENEAI